MSLEATLFIAFLGASFMIGSIASRYINNVSDYYVAGARMPWFLLVGTFVASNVSAGTFLGATNMSGSVGYALWAAFVPTSIGFVLGIAFVGVKVRRLAEKYEILDFADILAVRYNSKADWIRILTTLTLPLVYIPMLAAQLIGIGTIASGVFELPYTAILIAITTLIIIYTMLGGMLGVIWTDGFQFVVLLAGLLIAVPVAMSSYGGGNALHGWEMLSENWTGNHSWTTEKWPWFIALGQFVWLFSIPVQPHLVTRFLAAKDERTILTALPVCLVAGFIIFISIVPIGLLGSAVSQSAQDGTYYYINLTRTLLGPWLGAFALAGIAAAALSTCSTVLIVTGQSLSREIYQKLITPHATQRQALIAARLAIIVVGSMAFAIALYRPIGIFWLVVLSASLLASVFFIPIFAGLFMKTATAAGALTAMISGGIGAILVYTINSIFDTHIFIHEVFAGVGASALAMFFANRFSSIKPDEEAVIQSI